MGVLTSDPDDLRAQLDDHLAVIVALQPLLPLVREAARWIAATLRGGGKVFWIGNGGSAADCQHMSAELVGRFLHDRPGLASLALSTDTSALTAIGNDFGYEHLFARQLEALASRGDVVMALSTSGNSPNVVRGLEAARRLGCRTVGLTGQAGGTMASLCDVCLAVPSRDTPRIQEAHGLLGHLICGLVDKDFAR